MYVVDFLFKCPLESVTKNELGSSPAENIPYVSEPGTLKRGNCLGFSWQELAIQFFCGWIRARSERFQLHRVPEICTNLRLWRERNELPLKKWNWPLSPTRGFSGFLSETSRNRIIESVRFEKTSKVIKSNRQPNTTMPAKPCPKVPHLHVFWTPPRMVTPPRPWAACSSAWQLFQ